MEDMGNDPAREASTCGHPVIGESDVTERATATDQYAAKHDPFMYFHSIIDSASCEKNVVPLTGLEADLRSASRTPSFAFISPSLCHDGHDGHDRPCRNGEPGGLVSANEFLAHWVLLITHSPAFRDGGLLIVTFDEAASADAVAVLQRARGAQHPPNRVRTARAAAASARCCCSPSIKPGTVSDVPYNHYSMLRSIEDVFGLKHLGYAGQPGLASFGADVYTSDRVNK